MPTITCRTCGNSGSPKSQVAPGTKLRYKVCNCSFEPGIETYVDRRWDPDNHRPVRHMSRLSALRSVLAIEALIILTGLPDCVPKGVVWLPDSSGIVFSDKEDSRLICFDLKRNARKVLIDDTNTKTPWPAISVDIKRLSLYVVFDCATSKPRLIRVNDPFGNPVAKAKGG